MVLGLVGALTHEIYIDKAHYSCRITSEDFGVMGLRYGSANLSIGATVMPFSGM